MSKNKFATRDSKKPASEKVKAEEAKAAVGATAEHTEALSGAVEHFAPMVADKSMSAEDATATIMKELTSLESSSVMQCLLDRADELVAEQADQAASDQAAANKAVMDKAEADVALDQNKVIVSVPHDFRLTLADGRVMQYKAGAYPMPSEHAMHWYAIANGVTVVES